MTGHGLGGVFLGGLGLPAHSEEHVPSPNPGKGDADLADTDRGGVGLRARSPWAPYPKQASKQASNRGVGPRARVLAPKPQASKQASKQERSKDL